MSQHMEKILYYSQMRPKVTVKVFPPIVVTSTAKRTRPCYENGLNIHICLESKFYRKENAKLTFYSTVYSGLVLRTVFLYEAPKSLQQKVYGKLRNSFVKFKQNMLHSQLEYRAGRS